MVEKDYSDSHVEHEARLVTRDQSEDNSASLWREEMGLRNKGGDAETDVRYTLDVKLVTVLLRGAGLYTVYY